MGSQPLGPGDSQGRGWLALARGQSQGQRPPWGLGHRGASRSCHSPVALTPGPTPSPRCCSHEGQDPEAEEKSAAWCAQAQTSLFAVLLR